MSEPQLEITAGPSNMWNGEDCDPIPMRCLNEVVVEPGVAYEFPGLEGKPAADVADYFNDPAKWKEEVPIVERSNVLNSLQNGECTITQIDPDDKNPDYYKVINQSKPDTFEAIIPWKEES